MTNPKELMLQSSDKRIKKIGEKVNIQKTKTKKTIGVHKSQSKLHFSFLY